MPDILIRNFEMPKDHSLWLVIRPDGVVFKIKNNDKPEALKEGTAIFLPEGHGKLGDLDKIISFIDYYERPMDRNTSPFKALNAVRDYICNASNTIIEAEEGGKVDKKMNCSDCGNRNTPVCKYCEHDAEGGVEE